MPVFGSAALTGAVNPLQWIGQSLAAWVLPPGGAELQNGAKSMDFAKLHETLTGERRPAPSLSKERPGATPPAEATQSDVKPKRGSYSRRPPRSIAD
jgi:hypothetical protein